MGVNIEVIEQEIRPAYVAGMTEAHRLLTEPKRNAGYNVGPLGQLAVVHAAVSCALTPHTLEADVTHLVLNQRIQTDYPTPRQAYESLSKWRKFHEAVRYDNVISSLKLFHMRWDHALERISLPITEEEVESI